MFAATDNLLKMGERITCLERCFNVTDGFRRKADLLEKLKESGMEDVIEDIMHSIQ